MNQDSTRRLGRGLAALIGEMDKVQPQAQSARADGKVPIESVEPNPRNPRRSFRDEDLEDLAQSIRTHGIVQPVVVRPTGGGRYEIVAGERRWRAAQRAGLTDLPVIIREVSDRTALEIAIVENVQRSDLNAVEEAQGYDQLIEQHGYSQADLGQVIGRSRSHVANTLRLLKLPDEVRQMIIDGNLSAGHARTLVTAQDPVALAHRIVKEGLSVRQAEALAQEGGKQSASRGTAPAKDADTDALEKLLRDVTGFRVDIRHGSRGGQVAIRYKSLEQLDEICRRLKA